jgi:hypothetical protein
VVWSNQSITLYHGTHTIAKANILRMKEFDLARCRADTDFGTGMYTTTNKVQAEEWARRAAFRVNRRTRGTDAKPHVMEFAVAPEQIAKFQSIFFIRSTSEYWELVRHCRDEQHHSRTGPTHWYDLAAGLVANTDLLSTIEGYDQLSFHTPEACAVLYNSLVGG